METEQTATLLVPKIHCSGCVENIVGALEQLPGVDKIWGDAEARTITVVYQPGVADLARIKGAVAERGFEVQGVLGSLLETPSESHAGHSHTPHGRAWVIPVGLGALALGTTLAVAGYFLGYLGYAYAIAVPQAFGRFSVVTVAAISGLAAFFSPCVFPLLPGFILYHLGESRQARLGRAAAIGLAGAAGVVVVNLMIGSLIAAVGTATPFQPDPRRDIPAVLAVRFVAGAMVVGLGLLALSGRTLGAAVARFGSALADVAPGSAGTLTTSFIYGLTYNAAGLGCTGPILLALVLYALASGQALLAFAVFSLTMAALMFSVTLLSGMAGRATTRLAGATEPLQRIGAVLLLVVGTYTMLSLSFGPGREVFVKTFLPFLR